MKAAYKLVTEGKFSDALKVFVRMLQIVPLMVVDTRKEVDEVGYASLSSFCCLSENVTCGNFHLKRYSPNTHETGWLNQPNGI